MQETNVRGMLDAIDAKLPNIVPVAPGRRPVPKGIHHFALVRVSLATQTVQTPNGTFKYPRLDWDFQVLSTENEGLKYKGRRHRHFMSIDPASEESLGEYRGFAAKVGVPEPLQNSIKALLQNLEDPKVFIKNFGPLPQIEAKINLGSKKRPDGTFPAYLNPIRVLEPGEVGSFDNSNNGAGSTAESSRLPTQSEPSPEEPAASVETANSDASGEELPWPTSEDCLKNMTAEECRTFLTQDLRVPEAQLPADEAVLREAAAVVASVGSDEDPTWTPAAETALLAAFGVKKSRSNETNRQEIAKAVNKALS